MESIHNVVSRFVDSVVRGEPVVGFNFILHNSKIRNDGTRVVRKRRNMESRRGIAPAFLLGGVILTGGVITYSLATVQDLGQVLVADPWARVAVGIQFIMSVFVAGMAWQQTRSSMKVQVKLEKTLEAIQQQQHEDRLDIARHDERLNSLEAP